MDIICEYKHCTGCQACKNICPSDAITMSEDEHGFVYPVIDAEKCVDCGTCQKICPSLHHLEDFCHPKKTYAGWTLDNEKRHYSTSGGAAYALSKKIIEEGGVVCGCCWKKNHAEHIIVEDVEELHKLQGSKYAYSDTGECFSSVLELLKAGRKVMFIGTGCQVAGLKLYLRKNYDNLVTVDILCHGIPSQKALRDRLKSVELDEGKEIVDMRFRDKREDQSHTNCKYIFNDATSSSIPVYHDCFYCGFDSGFLLRPNCFDCQYAQSERISDITLADFWGYTPGKFSFLSFREGVSLILANTDKGLAILDDLEDLKKEERPYYMAIRGNHNLKAPQDKPVGYDEFWSRYVSGETLDELASDYFPVREIPSVTKNTWRTYLKIIIGEEVKHKISTFKWKEHMRWAYGPFIDYYRYRINKPYRSSECERLLKVNPNSKHVFYFGIVHHSNLGDLGQMYCIKRWIAENYPKYELLMFESCVITDPNYTKKFFGNLKQVFGHQDVIVIQSGYSTQDLGGDHPLMHRLVCEYMQDARIIMMPQTIFFKSEANRRICAENHNKARNMLFLARDNVSYKQALEMFPDIHVEAFPDIVTTLIGTKVFDNKRKGVCLCTRNDGEKLYGKIQIDNLAKRLEKAGLFVKQKDTQSKVSVQEIRANLEKYINDEIESYSKYEVTITDRYHGTIFSLCAGTPVIIIKTNDHKVVTGADWFKGIYDEYVYVASDLDDAYEKAQKIIAQPKDNILKPYFKENYYNKLKDIFESKTSLKNQVSK